MFNTVRILNSMISVNTKTEYFLYNLHSFLNGKQTRILKGIAAESGGFFIVIKKINYRSINGNDYGRYVRIGNQCGGRKES